MDPLVKEIEEYFGINAVWDAPNFTLACDVPDNIKPQILLLLGVYIGQHAMACTLNKIHPFGYPGMK